MHVMPRARTTSATDNVSALERGFAVLDCLAAARRPLGNADIADATGIPKATVSRLVATLMALGHVRSAADGNRYELASGVVRLATAFLADIDLRELARPHLAVLAESTGGSAFLGVRDGNEILVVEAARSRSAAVVVGAGIGTRMAIERSALGRAWLAGIDEPTRASFMAQACTRPAPEAAAVLERALANAQACGYVTSLGEWHPDINAVAVPVRAASGEVVAINCGGPAFVLPAERLHEVALPRLLAAAEALARDIGGVAGRALTDSTFATQSRSHQLAVLEAST